ncbi:MGMT family protein [Clostridium sp. CS001]|uniref:MGMT family protein n=1 Tax=Clostridium sp. CS001 TaxID=2880648 RepID=UPI001CF367E1|nr:MGMT family protein [Clostridium sp. CS001]MCB2288950.1 MGMT family protein [Clostridium sp. CS001]
MQPFTERVLEIIKSIPEGKVMTYGKIATLAGSPRGARQVVRVLHTLTQKHNLPWHRVINSKGEIGIKDFESHNFQKMLLLNEGVKFTSENTINLNEFQFHGYDILKEPDFEW